MRTFIRDILYGLRIAFKNPIMLITSTACLGIGIGIFLLMFIPLNTLMIKPLPFTDSHELIWVHESHPKHNYQIMSVSYLNYLDWKSSITCVEELAAFMKQDISVERGETSQRIVGTYVTRDFFKLLDLSPDFGQFPDSKDDWIDSDGMEKIVISYSFWSRYFDKGPVINETIILGGISHRIVGIMPENYEIPSGSDVWMRLRLDPQAIPRDTHFLWVIGRLRNDVSLNEASAQIQ
ncbi:ABC transporter permease, partial [bacterium]|nr:ABC transporter permease [candidate division CSSED10-310 bacterium]